LTTFSPSLFVVAYMGSLPQPVIDAIVDTDSIFGPMFFRDELPLTLTGTSKRAATFTTQAGPATPFGSSAYSQFCSVRLYADHTRDADGLAAVEDGRDRAWASFGPLDRLLNKTTPLTVPTSHSLAGSFVQASRGGPPNEFFDTDQNLPYVAVNYDIAVLADTAV
jgi:hypothetical protein